MERAGYAEKVGGRYEDRWALRLLLEMLAGEFCSIEREPVGDDEVGVDLWGNRKDGIRECFQCKAENGDKAAWTLADLRALDVLSHMRLQLERDPDRHFFCFVSATPAPDFEHLCRSARDSRDAQSLFRDQVKSSARRTKAFSDFCTAVGLTDESNESLGIARDLLSRSRFCHFQDSEDQRRDLRTKVSNLVHGDPENILRLLGDWIRDQLRYSITPSKVRAFLEARGHAVREGTASWLATSDETIRAALKILRGRFMEPLRYSLAGGRERLIRREESRKVLEALKDPRVRVVVVHGVAGSGKSGVLYEMALDLTEQHVPFLPVRLDRCELRRSPEHFGNELGLPGSPGQCLASVVSEEGAVLVLDQLDALRWTGAHSSVAWEICREVMAEALAISGQIKLVVCCRTFDLEHDPQMRGWEREIQNLRRIEVGELNDRDIDEAIRSAGDGAEVPTLRHNERKLLRLIQHLQMWLAIYASSSGAPEFDTALALMHRFWANRRDQMSLQGISAIRSEEILLQVLSAMEFGARLSASPHRLNATEKELDTFQSLHLLQIDRERRTVSFCHQSYLDYLVVRHLLSELKDRHDAVLEWLGEVSRQSLFRREQLRLVLSALREEEGQAYISTLRDVLCEGGRVRFHLRQLTLQFLGQVLEPRAEEEKLVFELFQQAFWQEHVLAEVMNGNVAWFALLDDQGTLEDWLETDGLRDTALKLIRGVVEKSGDRVARLLRAYLGKGEDWSWRIGWTFPFDPSVDSEGLFQLRLEMVQVGTYSGDHVNWEKLAKTNPVRFFLLASHVLIGLASRLTTQQDEPRHARRVEADWYGFDPAGLAVVDTDVLVAGWRSLSRSVGLVARAARASYDEPATLESYSLDLGYEVVQPVVEVLRIVGGELLARDWRRFAEMAEELVKKDPLIQVLLLDSLAAGPSVQELADWALCWMLADPWRARLRFRSNDDPWGVAAEVVARYSPICSEDVYLRFETALLDFLEPDFGRRFRYRHKLFKEARLLAYRSFAGATQYHLLPKLPAERRSERVRSRILELNRKFDGVGDAFFSGIGKGQGGFVASPISEKEVRNRLSDKAWLAIITSDKLRSGDSLYRRWRIQKGDVLEESSIGTFASDLLYATQRQPERFAQLALKIPEDAPLQFLRSIISGLASSSAPDHLNPEEKEHWLPASHEALESVLRLVQARGLLTSVEVDLAEDVCRILQNHASLSWSRDAVAQLAWIATEHSDPAPDYFPISFGKSDVDSADRLESNALNVTRGAAAYAIKSFVFAHPDRLEEVLPAIERLIRDAHPAVRAASLSACLPVLNRSRPQAISLFLTACNGSDAVLATSAVESFLYYTLHSEPDDLRGLVERMLASERAEVVRLAARRTSAAHLTRGVLADLYRTCLEGSVAARQGVAEVAALLLGEASFANQAKVALLALADDQDREVAKRVAQGFRKLDLRLLEEDREAWTKFARSRAFQAEPSYFLHALERQTGDLRPFADCLLAAGSTFCEELAEASRNVSTGIAADVHYLVPLLLRLYDQTKNDSAIHQRCLDLWDKLLEKRVGEAMGLTREIDKV